MNNLRDVMRGWRETLLDNCGAINDVSEQLRTLTDTTSNTTKTTDKFHLLNDNLIDIISDIQDVNRDIDDASKGKINDHFQPKIVKRIPLNIKTKNLYTRKQAD